MNYTYRDIVHEYWQLSPQQQDFVSSLVDYLGSKPLHNNRLYKLLTGPLYDCLKQPGTRCFMEAIQECANIKKTSSWLKLEQKAMTKEVGILSRDQLKTLRTKATNTTSSISLLSKERDVVTSSGGSILPQPSTEGGKRLKMLRTLSYQKILKVLQLYGCYSLGTGHTNGSHESRYSPISNSFFHIMLPHNTKKNEYRWDLLKSLLLDAGLDYDEFAEYYRG